LDKRMEPHTELCMISEPFISELRNPVKAGRTIYVTYRSALSSCKRPDIKHLRYRTDKNRQLRPYASLLRQHGSTCSHHLPELTLWCKRPTAKVSKKIGKIIGWKLECWQAICTNYMYANKTNHDRSSNQTAFHPYCKSIRVEGSLEDTGIQRACRTADLIKHRRLKWQR